MQIKRRARDLAGPVWSADDGWRGAAWLRGRAWHL